MRHWAGLKDVVAGGHVCWLHACIELFLATNAGPDTMFSAYNLSRYPTPGTEAQRCPAKHAAKAASLGNQQKGCSLFGLYPASPQPQPIMLYMNRKPASSRDDFN